MNMGMNVNMVMDKDIDKDKDKNKKKEKNMHMDKDKGMDLDMDITSCREIAKTRTSKELAVALSNKKLEALRKGQHFEAESKTTTKIVKWFSVLVLLVLTSDQISSRFLLLPGGDISKINISTGRFKAVQ
jgi:hypothetical protein